MDNKSFSLQFNPLTNVKCVKDYEEEIANLKAENFELKAQITHSNIPKVLYENKQEMEQIQAQKQELQVALENLNGNYQNLIQEKKLLENKYNQDMALASEKNAFIEDENKRILLRLEKLNKEVQEAIAMKNEFNHLKETIQNNERQLEQQKYFYEKELEEWKMRYESYRSEIENLINSKDFQIEKLRKESENEINNKNLEIENLRKKNDQLVQKDKNSSFIISDLKATIQSNNRNNEIKEKDEFIEKIKKEHKVYLNGMDKFKTIISKKMMEIMVQLQGVNENFLKIKSFCFISDENMKLLNKLNVKYQNISDLISFFKEKHTESHKKIEILRKEVEDAVYFAKNNKATIEKKTLGILQDFREQFNEAKNELLVCKKYLEKKALENKNLKNENLKLMNEIKSKKVYSNAIRI